MTSADCQPRIVRAAPFAARIAVLLSGIPGRRWIRIGASAGLWKSLCSFTPGCQQQNAGRACGTFWQRSDCRKATGTLSGEISGGQQRRVGLARILMVQPDLIVLDEPTSGLDVSVQAVVLRLFLDLRERFGLTYLFISHDLAVVRLMAHRIAVMYLGKVVELGATAQIFAAPRHPYTQTLLASVPVAGGRRVTADFTLEGEPPNPANKPTGCAFRTRCKQAKARCAEEEPPLRTLAGGIQVACHFAQ